MLGVVLLAAFVFAEQHVSHPLLPLRVILDRARGGSYVAVFLVGIAIFGVFLFLTYYLQTIKGYSPLTSGLLFLPMVGCILLSSNFSSIVALPRVGPRVLIAIGMVLGACGTAYLSRLTGTAARAQGDSRGPDVLFAGHQDVFRIGGRPAHVASAWISRRLTGRPGQQAPGAATPS